MEYSSKDFYPHGIKGAYSEGEKQGYMFAKRQTLIEILELAEKHNKGYESDMDKFIKAVKEKYAIYLGE